MELRNAGYRLHSMLRAGRVTQSRAQAGMRPEAMLSFPRDLVHAEHPEMGLSGQRNLYSYHS